MPKSQTTKPTISLPLVLSMCMLLFLLVGVIVSIDKQPVNTGIKAKEQPELLTNKTEVNALDNDLTLLNQDPVEPEVQILNAIK
jgi:hypothetical protein